MFRILNNLRDGRNKSALPSADDALPGRADAIVPPATHAVLGTPLDHPFPEHLEIAMFGLGCFWGAERKFWQTPGVYSTAAGYAGGITPNPTYREVCSGMTGHNEVVRVVFDPSEVSYGELLHVFWDNHDPTQGMRQGNDIGTQYRSGVYTFSDAQAQLAREVAAAFAASLAEHGFGALTTEIVEAPAFYFAEEYHQQYLHKNPNGYCGLRGTGVSCPA